MKKIIFLSLLFIISVSCKKTVKEEVKPSFVITLTADSIYSDSTLVEAIPVIFTNGLDYFSVDTVSLKDRKMVYKGKSDSLMQVTFRFPKKDINVYLTSGDTIDINYDKDIIRISGDTLNTKLYEFYRKNVYFTSALRSLKDSVAEFILDKRYDNITAEWLSVLSDYIQNNKQTPVSQVLLKENLIYYTEMSAINNLHKVIENKNPVITNQITEYTSKGRVPVLKSKITSFNLRKEYIKEGSKSESSRKSFNIFDNNGNHNVITFWSYKDPESVKRVKELASLYSKNKNTKLRFVTISIDTDEEEWKKKVDEYKIPGRNFILQKGFAYDLIGRLGIRNIPHNIITNDKLILQQINLYGKDLEKYLSKNVSK